MMKIVKFTKYIPLTMLFLFLLGGCASVPVQQLPTTEAVISTEEGVFSLRDFSGIVPGQSTYDDVKAVCGEYGSFSLSASKAHILIPSVSNNTLSVIIKLPEWIVQSITCYASDLRSPETYQTITLDCTLSADVLFEITPGISNHKDISRICNEKTEVIPRSQAAKIVIPISNRNTGYIMTNQSGIVISVGYSCEAESIHSERVFAISDFKECIPGQTTFAQIEDVFQNSGLRIRSSPTDTVDQQMLILPSSNGCDITFVGTSTDDRIESITLQTTTFNCNYEMDTVVVDLSQDAIIPFMANLIPGHDTYEKIEEICQYDFGVFPREKGVTVQVPMENECECIIIIDPNGRIMSLEWKAEDWKGYGIE